MASEMMPLLDIVLVLVGLYFVGSPAMVKVLASARFVFWATITLVLYIINVSCLSAFIAFLSVLFMAVCSLLQHLGYPTAYYNHVLRRIERKIQAQLSALRREERRAADEIAALLEAIEAWDAASAALMRQIRDAEHDIRQRVRDYEPLPRRPRRPKQGGVTEYSRPPREPSRWALARWWRGEDAPVVFEARCDVEWIRARLSTVRGCQAGFARENEALAEALREVKARGRAVEGKPLLTSWGARMLQHGRQQQRQRQEQRQPPPKAHSRDFVRQPLGGPVWDSLWRRDRAIEENGNMLHACYDCGKQSHPWVYQYPTIAAAAQSKFHGPCPAARARWAASGTIWTAAFREPAAAAAPAVPFAAPFATPFAAPFNAPFDAPAAVPAAVPAVVPVAVPAAVSFAAPATVPVPVAAPAILPTAPPTTASAPAPAPAQPKAGTPAPLPVVPAAAPTTAEKPSTPALIRRSAPIPFVLLPAHPGPSATMTAAAADEGKGKGKGKEPLVSPTISELDRELAREEAARKEKEEREREKEEKGAKRRKKGKERMGREEEEELERERSEREKYRQRF